MGLGLRFKREPGFPPERRGEECSSQIRNLASSRAFNKAEQHLNRVKLAAAVVSSVPALAVRQGDPLGRHLELDHGGRGPRAPAHGGVRCLGDGLGPRQGLGLHGVQVQHVTGCRRGKESEGRSGTLTTNRMRAIVPGA